MTDEKHIQQKTELKHLVERYRNTRAPLGFTQRVSAHVSEESHRRSRWYNVLAGVQPSTKLVVTASFGLVVLVSIVVVQLSLEEEPELQIAQQKVQTTPNDAKATKKEPVTVAQTGQTSERIPEAGENHETQVAQTTELAQVWKHADVNSESANLAVLSEISVWLESGTEMTAPDFTEMPELNEIDDLFDTT